MIEESLESNERKLHIPWPTKVPLVLRHWDCVPKGRLGTGALLDYGEVHSFSGARHSGVFLRT